MDLMLVMFLGTTLVLTGLVMCLSIVGFGRIPTAALIVAITGQAVSFIVTRVQIHRWQSTFESSEVTPTSITDFLKSSDRLLTASQVASNVALAAAVVFVVAGAVRVWRHRSVLIEKYNEQPKSTSEESSRLELSKLTKTEILVSAVALLLFAGMLVWEVYDLATTDPGFGFYWEQPGRLLYPIVVASIVGLALAAFGWYAKRTAAAETEKESTPEAE